MSDKKFTVYKGTFLCKQCEETVFSMRLWHETAMVSWMCKNKHLNEVVLVAPKRKKNE